MCKQFIASIHLRNIVFRYYIRFIFLKNVLKINYHEKFGRGNIYGKVFLIYF